MLDDVIPFTFCHDAQNLPRDQVSIVVGEASSVTAIKDHRVLIFPCNNFKWWLAL
jgi:hypothetical protein